MTAVLTSWLQTACGFPGADLTVFTSRMDSMRSQWLANKTPFKCEKSLANSTKTPRTLTQFQKLQHLGNHCANFCLKTKISIETTQLSTSRPKWRMTCAELFRTLYCEKRYINVHIQYNTKLIL